MQCLKGCKSSWILYTAAVMEGITLWAHIFEATASQIYLQAGWEMPSAKTSKVSSGGLKWGKELSYQQLSQRM